MVRLPSSFLLRNAALLSVLTWSLTLADAHASPYINAQSKPVPSWYFGLQGSVNFVRDVGLDGRGGTTPLRGTLEFDEGYGMAGVIGYRTRNSGSILDNIRLEAELGLRDNQMDQFVSSAGGITKISDDMQVQTAMVNMLIDFDMSDSWRPYIGGGIGGARVHLDSSNLGISDEDTVFAYQGMVGLYYTPESFRAAEFGIGYRYLATTNPEFNSATTGSRTEAEYDAQSLEIGTRFYF